MGVAEAAPRLSRSELAARPHRRPVNHGHFSLAPSELFVSEVGHRASGLKSPLPSYIELLLSKLLQECRSRSLEPTRAATLSSTQHLSHDCQRRESEAVNHTGQTGKQRGRVWGPTSVSSAERRRASGVSRHARRSTRLTWPQINGRKSSNTNIHIYILKKQDQRTYSIRLFRRILQMSSRVLTSLSSFIIHLPPKNN